MSFAASAENTMKFLEVQVQEIDNNNNNNNNNKCGNDNNSECENKDRIFFKNKSNDSDDDDMVVIILEEDVQNNQEYDKNNQEDVQTSKYENEKVKEDDENENKEHCGGDNVHEASGASGVPCDSIDKGTTLPPKQKYIGIEVYTHLQQRLESQKMYPLLPCNMISSFAHVMEYVEYFDIPSNERKKLVIDLVKILAYSNNDYGSRDCFEYFVEHNMIDDIIKTIIDGTKNRYDINRFPHTNRKIVLSCVSLSNKIKIVKPSAKIEALFEEFKLNLCGLKRFFKMKEKKESKET